MKTSKSIRPKVSIIVPVYNVEKYLDQCLDSLTNQTLNEIEIICVNDGSTDGSLRVLTSYARRDKRIKVVDKKNGGLSSARNAGMKVSHGEYVSFVDSDDWVDQNMYQKLYEKALSAQAEIVICAIDTYDEQTKKFVNNDPYYKLVSFDKTFDDRTFKSKDVENSLFKLCVTAVDKLYSRKLLERTGAIFPEGLIYEDNPFFFKTFLNAESIVLVRESLYFYRINRDQAITAKGNNAHYSDIIQIQRLVWRAFMDSGQFRRYHDKLIEIKVYVLKNTFDNISEELKAEFWPQMKSDFARTKLSKAQLLRIPEELARFYLLVLGLKQYTPASYEAAQVDSLWEFNTLRYSRQGRVIYYEQKIHAVLHDLYGEFINLKYTGADGVKVFSVHVLSYIRKFINKVLFYLKRAFILPIKRLMAEHLSEEARKFIKAAIYLEFLRFKVKIENKKWNGPLVTVVTTFYNQSETIMDTVESVLSQYFSNFEYIIVNDGSRAEERKILNSVKDPRVTIVDLKENIGKGSPAGARNVGLARAKGKYIMCLDGDDMLNPTYLEKFVTVLETNLGVDIVTGDMKMFGAVDQDCLFGKFKAQRLYRQTILNCASMFRAEYLKKVPGFKTGIGYEDWEFWISLVENGANGVNIHDKVLIYRVAENSRYIEDYKKHRDNFLKIVSFHPTYRIKVAFWQLKRFFIKKVVDPKTAYINLGKENFGQNPAKPHVLLMVPWLSFGGAETLLKNFTSGLDVDYDFTFMTGHYSNHEHEEAFKEISNMIYHLPYLFPDNKYYVDFITNYIKTRNVQVLHIFHNAFLFRFVPEIKKANPNLKIVITIFNSDVGYFKNALSLDQYVDQYTSDNNFAKAKIAARVSEKKISVIRNGVDVAETFNPEKYNRAALRVRMGLKTKDLVVMFIGRLSQENEKDPEFVMKLAKGMSGNSDIKFIIVGTGPRENQFRNRYRSLKNLKFLGYRNDISRLLSEADLFILPSKIEGSPQTLAEAMAMGKVVLATPVGGVPELINNGKDGYFLDKNNIASVEQLIIDQKLESKRFSVGEQARRKAVKDFSMAVMVAGYRKLYYGLTAKQKAKKRESFEKKDVKLEQ